MALTNARDILNKKILGNGGSVPSADEIPIDIEGLSASKLSVGLEEIVLDIDQLSSSILTVSGKVEDLEEAADYSETEHVVGKWIDGSDIYEKTITLNNEIEVPSNVWTSLGVSGTEISKIISIPSVTSESGACFDLIGIAVVESNISMLNARSAPIGVKYITIQYTKIAAQSTRSTKKKSK